MVSDVVSVLPKRDPHGEAPRYGKREYIRKAHRIDGRDLKAWITAAGLTYNEAAERLGVSRSTVRKIVKGKHRHGIELSERIRDEIKRAYLREMRASEK